MISNTVVELSRLQFALTALYHFLFVPLTLGLSVMLAIMETIYVMTGKSIWKKWSAIGVYSLGLISSWACPTGLTMEFQLAPIGPITRIMWAMSLAHHWRLKDSWHFS